MKTFPKYLLKLFACFVVSAFSAHAQFAINTLPDGANITGIHSSDSLTLAVADNYIYYQDGSTNYWKKTELYTYYQHIKIVNKRVYFTMNTDLYYTDNLGVTINPLNSFMSFPDSTFSDYLVDGSKIYFTTSSGIIQFDTLSLMTTNINTFLTNATYITKTGSLVYVCSNNSVFSYNGSTWATVLSLPNSNNGISRFEKENNMMTYIDLNGAVFLSIDNGNTFTQIQSTNPLNVSYFSQIKNGKFVSIFFDIYNSSSSFLAYNTKYSIIYGTSPNNLTEFTDSSSYYDPQSTMNMIFISAAMHQNEVFIGASDGVRIFNLSNNTLTIHNDSLREAFLYGISFNEQYRLLQMNTGMCLHNQVQNTYQKLALPSSIGMNAHKIKISSNSKIYLNSYDLNCTSNLGNTWNTLASNIYDFDVSGDTIIIATLNEVKRSVNAGTSFQTILSYNGNASDIRVAIFNQVIVADAIIGNTHEWRVSTNGGNTFTNLPLPIISNLYYLPTFRVKGNELYCSIYDTNYQPFLFRTSLSSTNWDTIDVVQGLQSFNPNFQNFIFFFHDNDLIVSGGSMGIFTNYFIYDELSQTFSPYTNLQFVASNLEVYKNQVALFNEYYSPAGGSNKYCMSIDTSLQFVTGKAFYDVNSNQSLDALDVPLTGAVVSSSTAMSLVDTQGNFTVPINFLADSIHIINNQPYATLSNSSLYAVANSNNLLFLAEPISGINDLAIQLTNYNAFVSGFGSNLHIQYKNLGTTTQNADIKLIQPQNILSFLNATPSPTFINGDTLIWHLSALPPLATGNIIIHDSVMLSSTVGSIIHLKSIISGTAVDQTPFNNSDSISSTLVSSFDPNDKSVSPADYTLQNLQNHESLTYTIRFQNTGTYYATNVVVIDSLDAMLDASTFQFVSASHGSPNIELLSNHVLKFSFPNIMLPDSNMNEAASHGYIKFKIKPKTSWAVGNEIQNTAHIYFDFNAAVVTNTTHSMLSNFTSIQTHTSYSGFELFPNPAHDQLFVQLNEEFTNLEIHDALGNLVFTRNSNSSNQSNGIIEINTSELKAGIYFLSSTTKDGIHISKFIKQ